MLAPTHMRTVKGYPCPCIELLSQPCEDLLPRTVPAENRKRGLGTTQFPSEESKCRGVCGTLVCGRSDPDSVLRRALLVSRAFNPVLPRTRSHPDGEEISLRDSRTFPRRRTGPAHSLLLNQAETRLSLYWRRRSVVPDCQCRCHEYHPSSKRQANMCKPTVPTSIRPIGTGLLENAIGRDGRHCDVHPRERSGRAIGERTRNCMRRINRALALIRGDAVQYVGPSRITVRFRFHRWIVPRVGIPSEVR